MQCAFGRKCLFNDLCESTNSVSGVQGRGLLKRGIVVGKAGLLRDLFGGRRYRRSLGFARDDKGEGGASMESWLVAEKAPRLVLIETDSVGSCVWERRSAGPSPSLRFGRDDKN